MTAGVGRLPRYEPGESYDWNFAHAPAPVSLDVPAWPGGGTFLGRRVGSPLGVAAGPLLNGRWLLYYASLGFDVLTYKTVRSREWPCHAAPNLLPVENVSLRGDEAQIRAATTMSGTWAVSFGMPSRSPDFWRGDLEATRRKLPAEKLLSVSVVATEQPGWTIDDLANDYAQTARWAVQSGADCVETNFSCPNVCTRDGQLYQHPREAGICAQRVRAAIGTAPLLLKIGHVKSDAEAAALLEAVAPWCDGLVMTNSVALPVVDQAGSPLFDGQRRGICGAAIREASITETALIATRVKAGGWPLTCIGVGGIASVADVLRYQAAGAEGVQLATAAMIEPDVALRLRAQQSAGPA